MVFRSDYESVFQKLLVIQGVNCWLRVKSKTGIGLSPDCRSQIRIFGGKYNLDIVNEMNNNYVNKYDKYVNILRINEIVNEYILCNLVENDLLTN